MKIHKKLEVGNNLNMAFRKSRVRLATRNIEPPKIMSQESPEAKEI